MSCITHEENEVKGKNTIRGTYIFMSTQNMSYIYTSLYRQFVVVCTDFNVGEEENEMARKWSYQCLLVSIYAK